MHEHFSNFKKFIILKKIMWKKNFIWWKTSSFLGKIFNGKILRFFRQKWPLFWSKFLYFGYPENISGFRVLNVGFRVGFGYRPLGFGSGSGGLKCRVYPSGFRVFGSPDTSLDCVFYIVKKWSKNSTARTPYSPPQFSAGFIYK